MKLKCPKCGGLGSIVGKLVERNQRYSIYQAIDCHVCNGKGETMTEHIEQFFSYSHLPERLQEVSKPYHDMMVQIVRDIPRNPERTVALRKLLESKDAAVRAFIAGPIAVQEGIRDTTPL